MLHRISHRYYKSIRLFVIGMGAAVILPWLVLLSNSWGRSPAVPVRFSGDAFRFARFADVPFLILFAAIWLLLLGFVYLFEWVNEWFNDDNEDQLMWRTIMVVLMILILFPLNRMLLYHPAAAPMFAPARGIFNALFNFTEGARPENSLIMFYVICWLFAIWVTSNALSYANVGDVFQLGLLLNLFAIIRLATYGGSPFYLFIPFMVCSLIALALSQVDTKLALGYHSQGGRFSTSMWSQFGASVVGVALIGTLIASLLIPSQIISFLALFNPVWRGLGAVLSWLLQLLGIILRPIFIAIFNLFEMALGSLSLPEPVTDSDGSSGGDITDLPTFRELIAEPDFRYIFISIMISLGLFIIWVVLNRVILKQYREQAEERYKEEQSEDFDPLGDGMSRLRSWFNDLLGRRAKLLLAPDRIEDMYANLCRLADRRGYPREVSQAPDQYLYDLIKAFPGQNKPLSQLTGGYMRSHYGEISLPAAEMQVLNRAYQQVINSIKSSETDADKSGPKQENQEV